MFTHIPAMHPVLALPAALDFLLDSPADTIAGAMVQALHKQLTAFVVRAKYTRSMFD